MRFVEGRRTLDVVTAHPGPIERTLGCDLIYYAHEYDSYVLVQYKRFRGRGRKLTFRPSDDPRFGTQLARLRTLVPGTPGSQPRAWRLGRTCCFVKFCEPVLSEPLRGDLAPGMYLPIEYLDRLRASGAARGPRGGEVISYETARRWLNNTTFVDLVQHSWLGTDDVTSKQVGAVIRRALDAGDEVVLAAGRAH